MRTEIPSRMRALLLRSYEGLAGLEVAERPVPRPGRGEVLVRIAASPVNPSDLAFLLGLYAYRKELPTVPGIEASGTVVEAGRGLVGRRLVGKRVACAASDSRDGTWAQYAVVRALHCLPLPARVTDQQGAMALVNPLTAWGLMQVSRKRRARAVVNTAAASALGRMILRLSSRFGIEVVHVVRREEQAELLRSQGARYVLNSADPEFDRRLLELCAALPVRLAFDAVGGSMTGRLLTALPRGGRVTLYGALSLEPCSLPPGPIVFEEKVLDGFYLPNWLAGKNPLAALRTRRAVARLLDTDLRSEVRERVSLPEAPRALADYVRSMTEGKVLLVPNEAG